MSKFFKNISSYENLKEQYKTLLKKNHPDNGGDLEKMQDINAEYDALFKIWKDKREQQTGEKVQETADSTRYEFYTEYGWAGENYNRATPLKEISKIVKNYVKEKYPTYKFSVRMDKGTMSQELKVKMLESPIQIYKPFEDLTSEDFHRIGRKLYPYDGEKVCDFLNAPEDEKKRIIETSDNRHKNVINEATQAVIDDVNKFVQSYNMEDCDGMIDYFDVKFYYFGCCQDNGEYVKIVPKTARIKNKENKPATKEKEEKQAQPEKIGKSGYTYKITEGEDTRDGSRLWIVRIAENLSKEEYKEENAKMKELGAYYSKFKHGFLFRENPENLLTA